MPMSLEQITAAETWDSSVGVTMIKGFGVEDVMNRGFGYKIEEQL